MTEIHILEVLILHFRPLGSRQRQMTPISAPINMQALTWTIIQSTYSLQFL